MRRILFLILGAAAAILFAAGPALADSPHFVSASAAVQGNGDLRVSWKEAGLGSFMTVNYTASASGKAVWACINGGGNHPSATNKETTSGPTSASGTFESTKSGNITAFLDVPPPGPGSFMCPSGQTLEVVDVTYTNVSIKDTTNGITQGIPGTFTLCLVSGKLADQVCTL